MKELPYRYDRSFFPVIPLQKDTWDGYEDCYLLGFSL